jgi:hypothetical protein
MGFIVDGIESEGPVKLPSFDNSGMLAIASPEVGQQIFNTTWDEVYTFDGDVWKTPNLVKCINGDAAALVEGNPVIEDDAGAVGEVELTSTANSIAVVGVVKDVYGGGATGQFVTVAVSGTHNVLMNGNVQRGNGVIHSNSSGKATDTQFGEVGTFGITRGARSGGGASLVECWINITERF